MFSFLGNLLEIDMKLFVIGNLAPVAAYVELTPVSPAEYYMRKQRHSNAFLIEMLYDLNKNDIAIYNTIEAATTRVGPTALIIYELDINDAVLQQGNLSFALFQPSPLNESSYTTSSIPNNTHRELRPEIPRYTIINDVIPKARLTTIQIEDTMYTLSQDLSSYQRIKFNDFVGQYNHDYKTRTIFANPWSKMKRLIAAGKIQDMKQVYEYAYQHPHTRTARVLRGMIFDESLLTSDVHIVEDRKLDMGLSHRRMR